MSFIAGVLTFLLVIDCLLLIFLILMQLPKKDAGAGMAFGGAAADALFGAGSGNFLTQATRYATIALFVMALGLGYLEDRLYNQNSASEFEKALQEKQTQTPITALPPAASANSQAAMPTNNLPLPPVTPPPGAPVASSNAPAAPATSK
ncbi:MAG: preprotein translocase subunit SecG [Verrucomicrobiota bacterium]|jgi:preprotein translocase subunit SecG